MFHRRQSKRTPERGSSRQDQALRLLTLLVEEGSERMLSGDLTLVDHSMQAARLAWQARAPISLVAAGLLHDVGRLLHDMDGNWAGLDLDPRHEVLGADVLQPIFGRAVSEPVRLHVMAKRYLAAVEPGYIRCMPGHSRESFVRQGGAFQAADARAFLQRPFAQEAIQLRRWDDAASQAGAPWPEIHDLQELLRSVVAAGTGDAGAADQGIGPRHGQAS